MHCPRHALNLAFIQLGKQRLSCIKVREKKTNVEVAPLIRAIKMVSVQQYKISLVDLISSICIVHSVVLGAPCFAGIFLFKLML